MRLGRIALALLALVAGAAPGARAAAGSDPLAARLEALEQEVALLKRQLEVKREEDSARFAQIPAIGAGKDGFFIQSADKKFQIKLRGYAQADSRFFAESDDGSNDTFALRRVRPYVEGTLFENVDFRIMPDFAGGTTTLFDAYVNLRYLPHAQLQVGKFKPPVGLERLQSATAITFIERGFPTLLVPSRDLGVQVWGDVLGGRLSYALGAFNGVRDGGNSENLDVDTDDGKDLVARLFAHPFAESAHDSLRGLGLGVAISLGEEKQSVAGYRTVGQQTFFSYRAATTGAGALPATSANGSRFRVSPQGYYYNGPFGLLWEYVRQTQEIERGPSDARPTHQAWQLVTSWVLTGENASYRGVVPRTAFRQGGWGAFEVAARIGGIAFDEEVFPTFANPDTAAESALEWGFATNWYLNRYLKLALNYEHTRFDHGAAGGHDRESEEVLMTRMQIQY
jgi:phosphate-selective porin OprO/OprP